MRGMHTAHPYSKPSHNGAQEGMVMDLDTGNYHRLSHHCCSMARCLHMHDYTRGTWSGHSCGSGTVNHPWTARCSAAQGWECHHWPGIEPVHSCCQHRSLHAWMGCNTGGTLPQVLEQAGEAVVCALTTTETLSLDLPGALGPLRCRVRMLYLACPSH